MTSTNLTISQDLLTSLNVDMRVTKNDLVDMLLESMREKYAQHLNELHEEVILFLEAYDTAFNKAAEKAGREAIKKAIKVAKHYFKVTGHEEPSDLEESIKDDRFRTSHTTEHFRKTANADTSTYYAFQYDFKDDCESEVVYDYGPRWDLRLRVSISVPFKCPDSTKIQEKLQAYNEGVREYAQLCSNTKRARLQIVRALLESSDDGQQLLAVLDAKSGQQARKALRAANS